MNLIKKYGKERIIIASIIIVVILLLIGIWYIMRENHKQKILKNIDLEFKENIYIEYGQEKMDFDEYIKKKIGNPETVLPTNKINTKSLGKKEFIYKISKEGYYKEKTLSIEVKDTKGPLINFKEDSMTLNYNDKFDSKSNIESVKDSIDGDIPHVEEAKEKNYYLIEGNVDTSKPGDYKIKIIAVDKNMIKTEKEYMIHVNEEKHEEVSIPNSTGNIKNSSIGNNNPSEQIRYRTDIATTYVTQINAWRVQNGEPALPVSAKVQEEANRRAVDLISYYSHDGCGSGFTENIGHGTPNFDFFTAWKNSPGHNRTMLQGIISTVHPALNIQSFSSFAVTVIEYQNKWYAVTSFELNPETKNAWNKYWKDAGLI